MQEPNRQAVHYIESEIAYIDKTPGAHRGRPCCRRRVRRIAGSGTPSTSRVVSAASLAQYFRTKVNRSAMKFVVFAALACAAFPLVPAAYAQKPTAAPVKSAPQAAKAKAAPLFCVITGENIASAKAAAGKAVVKGKTVYFCCPGCIGRFNKASDAQKAAFVKANDLRVKQAMAGKTAPVATEPMKHGEGGAMHHGGATNTK